MCKKLTFLILLAVTLSVSGNMANADLIDGLLVWHGFNNLIDGSGHGHDAALRGNAYISDGLLWLDGDGDYADIGTVAGFGAVNPLVDALNDFTIAIAYASENTGTYSSSTSSMLVSIGPASAAGASDFSLLTGNDGQAIVFQDNAFITSRQAGIGYANGSVHLVIVTYDAVLNLFTFYHLEDAEGAVDHGDSNLSQWEADWSEDWDQALNYGIRLASVRNSNLGGIGELGDLEGQIDLFAIWDRVLDVSEMSQIPDYNPAIELASNASPSNESTFIDRDTILSWNPGIYAATHNVYFGTNFDDVNEADTNSDLLVNPGQSGTSYDPPGLLDWGLTYYWRIDEVNTLATPMVHKGKTWSFTVEPYTYAMALDGQIIALTVSSFDPKYEPNNTINGSGLDSNDLHDVNENNMWLSAKDATEPAWIQYQFDHPYKLHELMVWNYNRFREDRLGYGFKEMLIEHSLDGIDFTALDPIQLDPATGKEPTGPNVVTLNGIVATHIRLSAVSNFSGRSQYGLSEVRILYLPVRAHKPEPADGAENVLPGMPLQWRPGREASTHDVLIGTAIDDLTLVGDNITETSFMQDLVLSETYYWQVLETDLAELAGDIWSFSTQDFLVVDDFESYNTTDKQIWETWLDGLGFGIPGSPNFYGGNGTGSAVGDESSPSYMEETIVHSGSKSVPLAYKNAAVNISEITAKISDLSIGPDWTRADVKALTLYIHGSEDNLGGQLYIKVNDVRKDQSANLAGEYWQQVNIDLASFGVDLQNVTSMTIGIAGAGSSGLVYIDDIRLYPSRCVPQKVPGDLTGDCVVDEEDLAVIADNWLKRSLAVEYTFDSGFSDTSGNNRHGVGQNNPTVANGILILNGNNFVDIPLGSDNPFDGSRDFSVAMDFKTSIASILLSSARDDNGDNHSMSIFVHHWDEPYWSEVIYDNYTVGTATTEDDPIDGQWHSVVVTYDAGDEQFIVYLDGVAGEAVEMNPTIPDIAADTVRIGSSLNSSYPYNQGVSDLFGNIDNVRIFNFTLALADILRLPTIPTAPADLNGDGIVDQADKDIVQANIGPEKLWP
ncbi:MAG: LamG-like jellyroll fold domain-containing protein [Planctomycetota bacterium]